MPRQNRVSWLVVGFKGASIALMIGAPLAGVWVASSLAAFANRATWMPLVAGLLLFPGLPLAWDGWAKFRARKKFNRRFLTFADRLILRTLAINVVFLVVLLAAFPQRAFVALSTRGDWMLDGHHGKTAEHARGLLLGAAGAFEWLYRATHENPYRKQGTDDDVTPTPTPVPTTAPIPTTSASSSSSSIAPAPAPTTTTPVASGPQRYPWPETVHPAIAAMPKEVETSIESVGRYIAAQEHDPMLRVKALHDYVAERVAYDAPAYAAHAIPQTDYDADAVFRSQKGVCAGYASLLVALGKVTGDEIVYVVGDARSSHSPMEGEGHAWNAARIGDAWYLLDATWDAGSVDGPTFTKKYSTQYLFTPPDEFAIAHFPDKSKWQLLEQPLSRADFFRRPVLAPAFFAHGLALVSPDRSQVTVHDALDLTLTNPNGTFVIADLEPKSGSAKTDCTGDGHAALHCEFRAAGTYDVRLYVNDRRYGTYAYAGAVEVNARP